MECTYTHILLFLHIWVKVRIQQNWIGLILQAVRLEFTLVDCVVKITATLLASTTKALIEGMDLHDFLQSVRPYKISRVCLQVTIPFTDNIFPILPKQVSLTNASRKIASGQGRNGNHLLLVPSIMCNEMDFLQMQKFHFATMTNKHWQVYPPSNILAGVVQFGSIMIYLGLLNVQSNTNVHLSSWALLYKLYIFHKNEITHLNRADMTLKVFILHF